MGEVHNVNELEDMNKKQSDFYIKIRKQITEFLEKQHFEYGHLLLMAPDIFHLLVKLTLDKRVPKNKKIKLGIGIAYFLMPIDILPEAFIGPLGYMDDLAVAAYILNDFINQENMDLVYDHWAGDSDVLATIQNILTVADKYFGQGLWDRIKRKINS
ncbi:MAG TPA: DUF1232 domain-containing protein [Caldithrix sp.]|nr:DUF1232 domain-containing protein [Calditrichaceae bacterium]HEM48800.1 DUF1232 domain-containing protein [Caldithrix sp.]